MSNPPAIGKPSGQNQPHEFGRSPPAGSQRQRGADVEHRQESDYQPFPAVLNSLIPSQSPFAEPVRWRPEGQQPEQIATNHSAGSHQALFRKGSSSPKSNIQPNW